VGVKVGVANFFLGQSVGFCFITKRVRVGVAPCWNKLALRKNLRNLHDKSSFCSFRDFCVHTDGQTDRETDAQADMARSTRLVILIKNIYTLWGWKRFVFPVTYLLFFLKSRSVQTSIYVQILKHVKFVTKKKKPLL